jgi:hypothetical protein
MKKSFLILVLIALLVFSANAENYAVILDCFETMQGSDPPYPDRFWNDVFKMWETLFRFGWKDENIFVLYDEGIDEDFENPEYSADQYTLLYGIEQITDDGCYYSDVQSVFNNLNSVMTSQDVLFVFTMVHGDWTYYDNHVYLILQNGSLMIDTYFSNLQPDNYYKRIYFMPQCHSGSFDDLANDNTFF